MSKKININLMRERLEYNDFTGKLTWKVLSNPGKCRRDLFGKEAGSFDKKGYRVISIGGGLYKAHRVAWCLYYGANPNNEIDHINGDKSDNRILNLREATTSENCRNKTYYKNNTTGYKGVTFNKKMGKFHVKIKHNWKDIHIGYFLTATEAHMAYKNFVEKIDGVFYKS